MTLQAEHDAIVVAVDVSTASDAAISWAARDAAMRGVALKLLHFIMPNLTDTATSSPGTASQEQLNQVRHLLGRAAATAEKAAGHALDELHTEMQYPPVVNGLVEESRRAEMIVVGGRGKDDVVGRRLGSVSVGLLNHAHCPVVVMHGGGQPGHNIRADAPVLVGVDGSAASETATRIAFDEAARRSAPLVALHGWTDVGLFPVLGTDWRKQRDEGSDLLAKTIARWQDKFPDVDVHARVVCDVPAHWLLEKSRTAQLVVLGRHGRGWRGDFHLGSVASVLAESAQVPVMVV